MGPSNTVTRILFWTPCGACTLFLPLSQDCRLARIWLSMADTQESRSSRLGASKCHVWPVDDTMMKSAFSSSAGERRAEQDGFGCVLVQR